MASPLSRVPPAPKHHCRGLGSAAMTSTSASIRQAAAVPPSQDAISEILSWLPAKSLCRFRCVSKEWRALVSSPAFVAAQRSRAEPLLVARSTCGRTMQLMDTEGAVVRAVEAPDDGAWIFRASLGGLACFSSGSHNSGTLVMDLATGKTLLACSEPVAAPAPMYYTGYGFGRAARSGSLMVFRFVLLRPGEQMCEVLALGGDGAANVKWRRTRSPPMMVSLWYSRCSGVTANGALHYLSFGDDVLSFDLANEEWKVIRGPQGVIGGEEIISMTELNGRLCMAHMVRRVIDVWLLSDSSKGIWTRAYTMPRDPVFFCAAVVPLRVLRLGGGLLFYCYDYTLQPKLRVYNPHSGKCTEVKTPANLTGKIGLCSSNLDPRFCGQP